MGNPVKIELDDVRRVLEHFMTPLQPGVFVADRELRVTAWSEGAEKITGYSAADAVGRQCREVCEHTTSRGARSAPRHAR